VEYVPWPTAVSVILSIAFYVLYLGIYSLVGSSVNESAMDNELSILTKNVFFWVMLIIVTFLVLLPQYTFAVFQREIAPKKYQLVQEIELDDIQDKSNQTLSKITLRSKDPIEEEEKEEINEELSEKESLVGNGKEKLKN